MELCLSCTPMSWHRRILPATRLYCSCCTDIHCPFERRGTEQPNSWRSERIRVTMEFAMMCITRHFLVPLATKSGDDWFTQWGITGGKKISVITLAHIAALSSCYQSTSYCLYLLEIYRTDNRYAWSAGACVWPPGLLYESRRMIVFVSLLGSVTVSVSQLLARIGR